MNILRTLRASSAAPRKVQVTSRSTVAADLSDAILTGANLSGAILTGADLSGARLAGADLSNVWISNAEPLWRGSLRREAHPRV